MGHRGSLVRSRMCMYKKGTEMTYSVLLLRQNLAVLGTFSHSFSFGFLQVCHVNRYYFFYYSLISDRAPRGSCCPPKLLTRRIQFSQVLINVCNSGVYQNYLETGHNQFRKFTLSRLRTHPRHSFRRSL